MKFVLNIILFGLLTGCSADRSPIFSIQPVQLPDMQLADDSGMADSLKAIYQDEAFFLALREILSDPEISDTTTYPSPASLQRFYNALIHVHTETHAVRDSLIETYGIRLFQEFVPGELLVGVSASTDWASAWRNGERLTGNPSIDRLLNRYEFVLKSYSDISHHALLSSSRRFNVYSVGQQFKQVTGVSYAEPNGRVGHGDNITGEADMVGVHLTYSVGYGDCPAGCISRHSWDVSVDYSGNVMFLRSYGDPAP